MTKILSVLNSLVWGAPALVLILGVGIYMSLGTGFPQIVLLPRALRVFLSRLLPGKREEGTSSFRALCTALAATVGTGNLVGVAGAICLGGPGAVLWMWVCGFFGMALKYAEAVLAVRYRVKTGEGYLGGPMYIISSALGKGWRPLALCYSAFGLLASFGVGSAAQVNAVAASIGSLVGQEHSLLIGLVLAALTAAVLLGGANRIGTLTEVLIPFLALGYMALCVGVLGARAERIPAAFSAIVTGAFCPRAVTGGMLGSAFGAMRVGCSRGVFTNEAGMGTAAIAHGSAEVNHPAEQGLMGIVEVFLDTIVICTLTALTILVSGVPIPYGTDGGGELTTQAFSVLYGKGAGVIIALSLSCFAFATILGWGLYGGRCAQFLFGEGAWKKYTWAQIAVVVLSSVMEGEAVWQLSELFNGLMAIPNLLILAVLGNQVRFLTKDYKNRMGKPLRGGNYADFHQRQPL